MNISPIATSAIPATGFAAIVGVNPIAAPLDPFALPTAGTASGASIVDLSNLGQLLSAAAVFPTLQAGAGNGFGDLVNATQLFVDALNRLQTGSSDLLQNPLGTPFDNVLLLALDAQAPSGNGESLRARLAQSGITFQETSIFGGDGRFDVDVIALREAFDADPAGTSSLLEQAFQTLAQFAARLAAQNPDLFAAGENPAVLGSASANLFDVDLFAEPSISQNGADAAAVDAALQRLVADRVLASAPGENPTPAQSSAEVATETTAGAITVPTAGAAQTTNGLGVTDEDKDTIGTAAGTTPAAAIVDDAITIIAPDAAIAVGPRGVATSIAPKTSTINAAPTAELPTSTINVQAGTPVAGLDAAPLRDGAPAAALATGPDVIAVDTPAAPNTNLFVAALPITAAEQANANPLTQTLPPQARADTAASDEALRRLLADQTLRNAQLTNPVPVQSGTPVIAERAAAPGLVASNAPATPLTGSTALAPAAAASVDTAAATIRRSSMNAGTLPSAGVPFEPVSGAAIFRDFAAPDGATGTAPILARTGAQTPLPLEDFNNLRFRAIDPSVAAAIAAYRVGDGFFGTPATDAAGPLPELITDIAAVTKVRPVTLDLHDGAGNAWRDNAARDAVVPVYLRDLIAASYGRPSIHGTVNLAV